MTWRWPGPGALACLLGLLAFLAWNGGHALSPRHIGWVMSGFDTPAHYLGWEFFRHAPWWQWPLGANPAYGSDAPGTIVLTDGIPIVAFFFKLISPLLPADFQYFGIWILACFLLQAWFGFKLVGRMTADPVLQLLGCAFFLMAPIFLMRLYLHPALAGQWLLLAAFHLGLDERVRRRAWLALLVVAALVHAYLLVMAGTLWAASVLGKALTGTISWRGLLRHMLVVLAVVMTVMWIVGYFVRSAVMPADHISHTNLLTFLITGTCGLAEWSRLLPCMPIRPDVAMETGDGFGYFGLGFLLLVPLALALRFWRRRVGAVEPSSLRWRPLLVAAVLLLVYAIGNKVFIGNTELLSFTLTPLIERVWTVFRGAARMEWVAWYAILCLALGVIVSRTKQTTARAVLLVALALQCIDLSGAMVDLNKGMAARSHFHDLLTDAVWQQLPAHHTHAVFLPAAGLSPYLITWNTSYRQVAHYAALHDLTINAAYLARLDVARLAAARSRRVAMLEQGAAEPSSFYVVDDAALWTRILCAPNHGQWHGHLNGMQVLVPDPLTVTALPAADTCRIAFADG
jgi:hypothetical protein